MLQAYSNPERESDPHALPHIFFEPQDVRVVTLPWQAAGLTYTASGYGKKIPTRYMVLHAGRWHVRSFLPWDEEFAELYRFMGHTVLK